MTSRTFYIGVLVISQLILLFLIMQWVDYRMNDMLDVVCTSNQINHPRCGDEMLPAMDFTTNDI